MGIMIQFYVRCDRCGDPLLDDPHPDPVIFDTYRDAMDDATGRGGWDAQVIRSNGGCDDAVKLICTTCISRARAMHEWIKKGGRCR